MFFVAITGLGEAVRVIARSGLATRAAATKALIPAGGEPTIPAGGVAEAQEKKAKPPPHAMPV